MNHSIPNTDSKLRPKPLVASLTQIFTHSYLDCHVRVLFSALICYNYWSVDRYDSSDRTNLYLPITFLSVSQRTSNSLSSRPLYCTCEHADVYSMAMFFTLCLRWLGHMTDAVPSLRPVVCHALSGLFYTDLPASSDEHISDTLLVLPHGEIVQSHSWLATILDRHTMTWRGLFFDCGFHVFYFPRQTFVGFKEYIVNGIGIHIFP